VAAAAPEQVGVLVIRASTTGDPPRLWMRITRTSDLTARDEISIVTANVDQASWIVRAWLDELCGSDGLVTEG
jgi:hypothetical protein